VADVPRQPAESGMKAAASSVVALFGLSAWWSDNLSSYRVYGSCYYSTVTNSWGTTRYGAIGDQDYVGDSWNDDVVRFRTWAR
jgi:hypothetical protein